MKKSVTHGRRILAVMLALMMTVGMCTALAADSGDWSAPYMENAQEKGWITPEDGAVAGEAITRASFAVMLWRALGSAPSDKENPFSDVNDPYYADAVITLYHQGILKGVEGSQFAPDGTLTREMAVTILARAYNLTGDSAAIDGVFTDAADISSWAKEAVAALAGKGYVYGVGNGQFGPKNSLTWGESAKFLSVLDSGESASEPCDFKVITLGTGAPPPEVGRFGPAVLVQVNGQNLLFDAGRGVMQRLYQYGLGAADVDMVFITHLHSDHTVGLPDLYLTGMLNGAFGLRTTPFKITGIEGTAQMMEYIKQAYSGDINIRMNDGEMTEEQTSIEATEFTGDGVVYERDGVTVTAIENFHGEAIDPSYGYRIDYDGRSVVISGDTKYCENIIEHSKGVDLLIHSVGMANEDLLKAGTPLAEKAQIVLNHHTPPEDAASVFNQTQPKLAVFNHMVVVTIAANQFTPPTQQNVFDRTREAGYSGPLVIAKDLMIFEVGETINVIPWIEG